MPPRFFCSDLSSPAVVEGDELRHMRTVRRLAVGDEVELFDGRGRLALCTLSAMDRHRAECTVRRVTETPPPGGLRLTVATAIPKAGRMDWLVEKVTELGAAGLWPLVTDRSSVTADGREKPRRWRRRAVEASKQCGRLWLPEIAEPMTLGDALERLGRDGREVLLAADASPDAERVADVLGEVVGARPAVPAASPHGRPGPGTHKACPCTRGNGSVRIVGFVGPEGGFSDAERAALRDAGARAVRLAPNVLRIETAAVALAAAVAAAHSG